MLNPEKPPPPRKMSPADDMHLERLLTHATPAAAESSCMRRLMRLVRQEVGHRARLNLWDRAAIVLHACL